MHAIKYINNNNNHEKKRNKTLSGELISDRCHWPISIVCIKSYQYIYLNMFFLQYVYLIIYEYIKWFSFLNIILYI